MQHIRFMMGNKIVEVTSGEKYSDCRGPIVVWPTMYQGLVERICVGHDDGRGIPMTDVTFTMMGVSSALSRCGVEHEGPDVAPPDADGIVE